MIRIGDTYLGFNMGMDTSDKSGDGDELVLTPALILTHKEKEYVKGKAIGIEWLWFYIYFSYKKLR